MRRKIVFIDIDGPLAWGTWGDGRIQINCGSDLFNMPYPWVEEDCQALRKILDESNAKMVLSSDWKKHFSFRQMKAIFERYGIPGHLLVDITTHQDLWTKLSRPGMEWERAAEIKKWVRDNRISNWIAIDDLNLRKEFKWMRIPQWRHIQVDGDFGMGGRLRDKIGECIAKLNR